MVEAGEEVLEAWVWLGDGVGMLGIRPESRVFVTGLVVPNGASVGR